MADPTACDGRTSHTGAGIATAVERFRVSRGTRACGGPVYRRRPDHQADRTEDSRIGGGPARRRFRLQGGVRAPTRFTLAQRIGDGAEARRAQRRVQGFVPGG